MNAWIICMVKKVLIMVNLLIYEVKLLFWPWSKPFWQCRWFRHNSKKKIFVWSINTINHILNSKNLWIVKKLPNYWVYYWEIPLYYRVFHNEMDKVICLWQIETCKLDFISRLSQEAEMLNFVKIKGKFVSLTW